MARPMRWTQAWLAVPALAALACSKSPAKKLAEVRSCSAITVDAAGAAQCLVLQYKWKQPEALTAATRYQHEQDSLTQSQADATWRADAVHHAKEIKLCAADPSGDVTRCLLGYGWAEPRARVTADSLWRHDAGRHRQQVVSCARRRDMHA